jgi:hypothetical protein
LTASQPRFRQVNIVLDAPQDFVIDHALIAQLQDRLTFRLEGFVGERFVFG